MSLDTPADIHRPCVLKASVASTCSGCLAAQIGFSPSIRRSDAPTVTTGNVQFVILGGAADKFCCSHCPAAANRFCIGLVVLVCVRLRLANCNPSLSPCVRTRAAFLPYSKYCRTIPSRSGRPADWRKHRHRAVLELLAQHTLPMLLYHVDLEHTLCGLGAIALEQPFHRSHSRFCVNAS
jgi:hypothetical protein